MSKENQYFAFHLNDHVESKLPYPSSLATRIVKPHHRSRHHYSSERTTRVSSITNMQPKNVPHINIQSTSNFRYIGPKIINLQNKKYLKQKQRKRNDDSIKVKEEKQIHILNPTIAMAHHQKSVNNDFRNVKNQMRNTWSSKNMSVNEHHRNSRRKKNRKYFTKYCFGCPCPHVILFLLAALLLGIAVSAILVESLTKNKTTTITLGNSINTSPTTEIATTEIATTESITISTTLLTTTNETVYGVWNTTAGGDSTPSTVGVGIGNYYTGEIPNCAFDNTTNTKYTSFGNCPFAGPPSLVCGLATGLYLTPQRGPSLLLSLQFCTGNDIPDRDPFTITIEGSNKSSSLLTLGSSWTLIYNGSTGLQSNLSRYTCGTTESVPSNSIRYSSYRILVTSKRGIEVATQYSEVNLMGYQ